MRSFRLLFVSALLGITAGCSSNTTGTSTSNAPPPTPTPADITIVQGASTMTTGAFNPDTKTVSLSGGASVSVRWVNEDVSGSGYGSAGVTHHIVSDDGKSFDTGDLGGNQTSTKALTAAGTYTYHCAIHPNMVGSVVVNP
jgi:plastocyanin